MQHKAFWICISALAFLVVAQLATDFAGQGWQAKSAKDKLALLWARLQKDTTSGEFPKFRLAELFFESMDTSFDTIADDLPYQGFRGSERRPKLIHSVGLIATLKWRNLGGHPYTGLFQSGSNYGFARLSWAKSVDLSSTGPWLPGVAFKFLRNGVKSANYMAMTTLQGVDTSNFFAYDVTNHVPDLGKTADGATKALKKVFEKASKWPTMLGLSDVARFDENGTQVADPVFPYRLIFHAPANVRAILGDVHTDISMADLFLSHPEFKAPLSNVWGVWAEAFPKDPNPVKIAEVDFTSALTTSNFGDRELYFQHQRMEEDFAVKTEWVRAARAEVDAQGTVPKFIFPNLSD